MFRVHSGKAINYMDIKEDVTFRYATAEVENEIMHGRFYALRRIIRLDVLNVRYLIRQA